MEDDLAINADLTLPGRELQFTASRSSGPGGQHVQTASTRVQLRWNVAESQVLDELRRQRLMKRLASRLDARGVLRVVAQDTRSQHRNREIARERLAELVRDGLKKQKKRRPTRPTRASKLRRLKHKKQRGAKKALRGKVRGDGD